MRKPFPLLALVLCLALVSPFADAAGYRTTAGSGDDAIPLVVVSGTPHEMGYAIGSLMKDEVKGLLVPFYTAAKARQPEKYGDEALDAAWKAISPYTNKRYEEEIRGLAEGAGIDYDLVRRMHMVPVVSEYACSGAALWGEATRGGAFYQFRNLDYTMGGGLQNYPALVVYVPDDGIAHVLPTFAGMTGANTGMNAEGICLTEMGDSPSSEYPFDLDGAHFTFMFRDLLYEAHNLDEAVSMIQSTKRIKRYHYIIGDGKTKAAVKMLAHAPDLIIWTDNDKTDEVAPNIMKNIVYNCENRDPIGWAHMSKYYGRYTAESVIQLSAAVGSLGGNLMNAVYDGANLELWVAYAHGRECAFRRAYVHVDLKEHMDTSAPPEGAKVLK